MCVNLYLWLQNTMLTPVLFKDVLKLQVPMIPWEHLIAFTALCCGLYMGGQLSDICGSDHKVKNVIAVRGFDGFEISLDCLHFMFHPGHLPD